MRTHTYRTYSIVALALSFNSFFAINTLSSLSSLLFSLLSCCSRLILDSSWFDDVVPYFVSCDNSRRDLQVAVSVARVIDGCLSLTNSMACIPNRYASPIHCCRSCSLPIYLFNSRILSRTYPCRHCCCCFRRRRLRRRRRRYSCLYRSYRECVRVYLA